ncbi:HlyD family efflux transporter periplasmic adaptor subunit [Caulobacter sp. BK020]|uniref:HlyD family secretion protein n=1 Tax=Caulobacter sp. BK020 TaxID=2512117 RepID=UPI0010476984|nr:HlyD family efflux transporter periplasmic adaptor subunit [Caulobacter sp. BK020]TCS18278.1 HlyD family secretion protein [Caulobacter sp. BK020]
MKPPVRIVLAVVAVGLVGFVAWRLWGPGAAHPRRLSGYVEGETLYVGASTAGPVSTVSVQRGQRVAAGQPLFALDAAQLVAARDQAASQAAAAASQALDAAKGQRPDELAVYDAQRAAAAAALAQAQADYDRIAPLVAKGIYAPARLDQARAALKTAQANVRTVEQQRRVGTLGARPDAVRAAESQAAAARDQLAVAQNRLDQISPRAPAAARVQDVFYQPGEWVAANQPVVALLPDDRVRLRFYVPQAEVSLYRPGTRIAFACDGCKPGLGARINFVSPRAEFTPPVIYSRDARDRLVFLVEALPDQPAGLPPGLPIDVTPLKDAGR